MRESQTIVTCDVCGKSVCVSNEIRFGASNPMLGWFSVKRTKEALCLSDLNRKHEWDVCSMACVSSLAESK